MKISLQRSSREVRRQQHGAAMIIALLVVALVTAIAAGMATEYVVTLKRASNQISSEAGYSYLRAAEVLAVKFLGLDLLYNQAAENPSVNCNQPWSTEQFLVTEEGSYGGRIHDLQGRFNLNSVVGSNAGIQQARFYRLLKTFDDIEDFEVTDETARCVTEALVDWLDPDQNTTGFCGAEDDAYSDIEGQHPYRTADQPMLDISELLLVAHMTPKLYSLLVPHITVWPISGGEINVNTATARVLRSLNVPDTADKPPGYVGRYDPPLTELSLLDMLEYDKKQTYEELNKFITDYSTHSGLAAISGAGLSVNSHYFMLNGLASINEVDTRLYSVIHRPDLNQGKIRVLSRSFSQPHAAAERKPAEDEDEQGATGSKSSRDIRTCLPLKFNQDTGRLVEIEMNSDEADGGEASGDAGE